MNKLFTKIAALALGAAMAVGIGVAVSSKAKDVKPAEAAGKDDWVQVTALSGLNTTDTYVIANNADKGYYMNGSVSNGHFQSTAFSASNPASASVAGAFMLEAVNATNNIYKIKLVSTSKYVKASKAGSGGGTVTDSSDSAGWKFLLNGTNFDAIYQTAYSNKYAALRCYNSTSWRTYQNNTATSISTTSGTVFRIYKYSGGGTPSVSGVTVDPTVLTIDLKDGSTGTISATVAASGGASTAVGWSVEDADPAGCISVSGGTVTASSVGTATVRATSTFDNTKSATCAVKVIDTTPPAGSTEVGTTIADYADENNWSNGVQYESVVLDDVVTATATGGSNTGKYYTSGENWRLYGGENATLTVETVSGYKIFSITPTFTIDGGASFYDEDENAVTSGTGVSTNKSSYTFTLSSSGQIRITGLTVVYYSDGSIATQISDGTTVGGPYSLVIPSSNSKDLFIAATSATSTKLAGFTWTPADPTVVSVSMSGDDKTCTVTGLKDGSTTITAAKTGYVSSTVTINVSDLTPSVSFGTNSKTSKVLKVGFTITDVTATGANLGSATISYSSNHPEYASVNSLTGVVTGEATGTARITASATVNQVTYSDYYDVEVSVPGKGETIDNPFTVDEAIDFIDSLGEHGVVSNEKVYVKGIVSSSTAGKGTQSEGTSYRDVYLYSDDGETAGVLELYHTYLDFLSPVIADDADSMKYYEVIGYGFATYYNTNSQYELTSKKIGDVYDNCYVERVTEASLTSLSASMKAGKYMANYPLEASSFNVQANYNNFKPSETVTSGFTWTVNGVVNGNLAEGNNAVVVTYNQVSSASFNVVGEVAHAEEIILNDLTIFVGDNENIEYLIDPEDCSDPITWEITSATPAGCITIDQTGKVTGVSAGTATVTATVYGHSDTSTVTVNPLSEPTLVVSTGSGKTSYKFGETLDTSGWSATYTDGKGVSTPVQMSELDFGSLNYIGKKSLTATYNNVESNAVVITVTNNGATSSDVELLDSTGFSYSNMPTGWAHDGADTSDYGSTHTPYNLKLNDSGDKVFALVDTNASTIYAQIGVKMIGGGNTSKFTVNAYSSSDLNNLGDPISTIESQELEIAGKQNAIVTKTATLENPNGERVRTIEFTFTKGSNVGVGTGNITVNDSAAFMPKQALAYARYFLEQTSEYCEETISSDVKTSLINEYNWMQAEAKALFTGADIVRGKGVTYENDLSEALSRYVNMIEDKGYSDADFLNLGDIVIKKSTIASQLGNFISGNATTVIIIISVIGASALGGYFFLRRRKENI